MTVLDGVRALEEQVASRLRELEPLMREYEQLRQVAQRLGLDPLSGAEKTPAAARPRRDAGRRPGRPAPRAGQRDDAVLLAVADHPGSTVRELAARLGVAPAGLYRVVKRLTDAGRLYKDGPRLLASAPDAPPPARPVGLPDSAVTHPADSPEPAGEPTNAQSGEAVSEIRARTYVYGVVPADGALKALDDERLPEVWAMEVGDLAALVSDTRADDDPPASEARQAHWQVLAAAAQDTPVVPFRPGLVFASDDAVCDELLAPRRATLTQLLEQFPRLDQQTLPTYAQDHGDLGEILAGQPDIERLRETIRERSQPTGDDARVPPDERPNAAA